MTPPSVSEDMIRAATEIVEANLVSGETDDDTAVVTTGGLIGDIAQALAHLPAGSEAVKPTIWRYRFPGEKWHYVAYDPSRSLVPPFEVEPLFAAPPSTPPAANVQDDWDERAKIAHEFLKTIADGTGQKTVEGYPIPSLERSLAALLLRSKQAPTVAVSDEGRVEAWMLEKFDGSPVRRRSRIIDARIYDASSDDFWLSPEVKATYRITPLRARAEQREAPSAVVGEGWKLVPIEPTEAMLRAYWEATGESDAMRPRVQARAERYWAAMIAAAPTSDGR